MTKINIRIVSEDPRHPLEITIQQFQFLFIPMQTKSGKIRPFCTSENNLETQIFSGAPGEIKRQAYAKAAVYFKKSIPEKMGTKETPIQLSFSFKNPEA